MAALGGVPSLKNPAQGSGIEDIIHTKKVLQNNEEPF